MRKFLFSLLMSIIIISGTVTVNAADTIVKPGIDAQQLSYGVINASFNSGKTLKLAVEKNGTKIYYSLDNKGNIEAFPLQLGNGNYKITIFENISGTKYKSVSSKNVTLNMDDTNQVFLNSVQNVNWNDSMNAIKKAQELTQGLVTENEKISAIYNYIVNNLKYDYKKLSTLASTYVPSIESTFQSNTGICYDYSSLFASMLRSVGIPAKLVKGYTKNVVGYHAWNEIYDSDTDQWLVVDSTTDSQLKAASIKYSMVKSSSDYTKSYEY